MTYEKEFAQGSSWGFNDFMAYKKYVNVLSKDGAMYWQSNGTSFSAPQITAAIAKIMSYTGNYDRDYSYNLLKKHALPLVGKESDFSGNVSDAGYGYIDFKSLAEEFVTIHTKNVQHPDNENIVYQIVYSTDKASGNFYKGFIRYVFVNGTRFSLYKELEI